MCLLILVLLAAQGQRRAGAGRRADRSTGRTGHEMPARVSIDGSGFG
jgi:hypothetical protein